MGAKQGWWWKEGMARGVDEELHTLSQVCTWKKIGLSYLLTSICSCGPWFSEAADARGDSRSKLCGGPRGFVSVRRIAQKT